jgi:predicted metalloprotease with PDZ domain
MKALPSSGWLLLVASWFWLASGEAIHAGTSAAAPTLQMEVDARDLPRHLLHSQITIPCQPGKLKIWYPKWVPGTHGPYGPLQNVGGLRLETLDGQALPWHRDDVELYCVTCDVPAGVMEVRARLDYICNEAAMDAAGAFSYGNASVGIINWHNCLLYPDGPSCDDIKVRLSLRLPARWRFATVLKVEQEKAGLVTFRAETLTDLVDSPLIGGEHLRTIKLGSGSLPPAFLHLASESSGALQLGPKVVDLYSRVVTEAGALFGAAHYPEFHFLVTCSDDLGYLGLEHHASSLNGVRERDLIEDDKRKDWVANLIPHEYAHSWCGKYRRPRGMCTPNFHTPQKMQLLWVYEGLTTYLGDVLMVRSGLIGPQEYREMLAWNVIGGLTYRQGRRWRSLEDTAVASYLLRASSRNWNDLRREQDYYYEGMLFWLEADAIIRERSNGKRNLDDFCKKFMGTLPTQAKIVPYELPEIIKILKELADYDWEQLITRRVSAPMETLPLDVVGRCGYRLQYATKPSAYLEHIQSGNRRGSFIAARDSLGLTFSEDGRILNVNPGMVGDKAGLGPGMEVIGVNGRKFSRQRLLDALADSITRRKIELLLLEGDRFRTLVLDYADGPRYLELVRDKSKPDILADILKPAGSGQPR